MGNLIVNEKGGSMKLITKEIMDKLKANPRGNENNKPWLKLFNPVGAATWLISEIGEDGDTLFGLCDLGFGHPELGSVRLSEIKNVDLPFRMKIERDKGWEPTKTVVEYANEWRAI